MKRNLAAGLCAGAVLVSMACGAMALSGEDSLISLSYLKDVFMPDTLSQGREQTQQVLNMAYDNALEELEEVQEELLEESVGSDGLYSGQLTPHTRQAGEKVTVETGAGVLLSGGAALVTHDGAFVDVTAGVEVPSGEELTPGHRYLVGEDTTAHIIVISGIAKLGVQGSYELERGKAADVPFQDVRTDDWYYNAVAYVCDQGIFEGGGEGLFDPHTTMNRAMLMTNLYRLADSPEGELKRADAHFLDVADKDWYAPFVRWAASQEITAGIGEGHFGPNVQLTREQVVTLLYSFAGRYMGLAMDDGRADVSGYSDYEQSSQWAREALAWAVSNDILDSSWAGENTLGGHLLADRAEVAAMLAAFGENIL